MGFTSLGEIDSALDALEFPLVLEHLYPRMRILHLLLHSLQQPLERFDLLFAHHSGVDPGGEARAGRSHPNPASIAG